MLVLTYILRLKDITDHSVLLPALCRVHAGFITVKCSGLRHSSASHQDYHGPNVCNVGDGPKSIVYHCLLHRKEYNISQHAT